MAIVRLFSILAKWKGSLTLEFNAYSPSDSKHWFPNCYFGAPDEDKFECQPIQRAEPAHHIVVAPPDNALRRAFEIGGPLFGDELVPVQMVRKFILRRQCRRQFGAEMLLQILPKFPRLEEIIYEPWVLHFGPIQYIWDRGYNEMINRLPPNVKRVTVFEDFNESYLELLDLGRSDFRDHKPKRVRVACPILGLSFASRSREREHLSVAFMIDARHFFDACQPCWTWPKLQTLTLTSREMIKPDGRETNKLLQEVARVALNMSQLQTLTIWYGERKEACAFTYRRKDRTIYWQGNRDIVLESNTLEAWEKVAVKHSGMVLLVEKSLFAAGITSHGDAVHHLGLPHVVDKVSLQQIRAENTVSWL
ncbi:hypothetical protein H9Q72_010330 [Fusarium xylarioides]|uniref:DUF6546 domain-containing protein n=1 Tax=Fusarium xylarioides TaxID=221167 RepID=A0A9P7L5B3_9HYPO|nr:hypothetical protein H9Q72_010330 [Fusarium xylarioides]